MFSLYFENLYYNLFPFFILRAGVGFWLPQFLISFYFYRGILYFLGVGNFKGYLKSVSIFVSSVVNDFWGVLDSAFMYYLYGVSRYEHRGQMLTLMKNGLWSTQGHNYIRIVRLKSPVVHDKFQVHRTYGSSLKGFYLEWQWRSPDLDSL